MELIEREALLEIAEQQGHVTVDDILCADTIDAAPVVHGRWVMRGGRFHCSACDAKAPWRDIGGTGGFSHEYEQATTDVCSSCGARMDGGEDDG